MEEADADLDEPIIDMEELQLEQALGSDALEDLYSGEKTKAELD